MNQGTDIGTYIPKGNRWTSALQTSNFDCGYMSDERDTVELRKDMQRETSESVARRSWESRHKRK